MDNFRSLCQQRRSIRKYQNRPVEQEKIDYILQCALMAPSSKRTNPWEFIVVRDTKTLRAMQACRTYGSGMFETAQAAIVVALDASLTDTWQADGAITAEHILLAAEEQGLGACWCQVFNRPASPDRIQTVENQSGSGAEKPCGCAEDQSGSGTEKPCGCAEDQSGSGTEKPCGSAENQSVSGAEKPCGCAEDQSVSGAEKPCGSAEELIRELCGIPERLNVLCVISLGYKDEERRTYELDKLKYEKIHQGRFDI